MTTVARVAVARVTCPSYAQAQEAVRRALDLLGGAGRFCARGEPLLLKPNLLAPHSPELPVTTNPAVMAALLSVAADHGAKAVVADSPGLFGAEKVARSSGLWEVLARFDVPLLDLGRGKTSSVSGATYKAIELSSEALGAGRVWNVPKWKTHTMMGLTLGVKNLYGCVPGKVKIAYHLRAGKDADAFALLLLDLWRLLRPALTVLDGVVAMEGPGPSGGTPLARGLILASADAPALDWEACRLSGFSPDAVPTVRLSAARGLLDPAGIEVVGDEAAVTPFAPAPGSPSDFAILPAFLRRSARGLFSPKPRFCKPRCTGCGICVEACPAHALLSGKPPEFLSSACIRCYCCQELCPSRAVEVASPLRFMSRRSRNETP